MDERRDLEGLSALVIEATSGIGRAAAEELGRHVAEVVVHGRDVDAQGSRKAKARDLQASLNRGLPSTRLLGSSASHRPLPPHEGT
jgi:NAD(P)-dependent dehydrogenase (short-subunit alcohol dehydrogenase family)